MLAELLDDPGRLGTPIGGEALDTARTVLEDAAAEAVALGGWTGDDPLRLSKGPVSWLLRCPRRAVAAPEPVVAGGDIDALVIGSIVDAAAKLATLGARRPVTLDDALAFVEASDDRALATQHLADIGPEAADRLRAEAVERIDRLLSGWPSIDPAWWPRVEEPVRVRLAGGAVLVGGRLDVLLGGYPTDRPGLVVEVKSGRWHDPVRADGHLYALLVGLRDGVAPAAVLTLCAADRYVSRLGAGQANEAGSVSPGDTQLEPIRPAVLAHTAERVAVAMATAAHIAAGEHPAAYPGPHCAFCPLRTDCPEARASAAAA